MIDEMTPTSSREVTRRGLLKGALGAAGVAALGAGAFGATRLAARHHHRIPRLDSFPTPSSGTLRSFVSRPDLTPPTVTVSGGATGPGYVFLGPGAGAGQAGPLLVDDQGEPVWFQPIPREQWLSNVRAAHYKGKPVLTWWEGRMTLEGYGRGEGVIVDTSYREIARVRAGNGRHVDVHEFHLTPEGTALLVCYPETVSADLSPIGGPINGTIQQSIVQEVDVESGRLLLEWRSLDHIPIEESYQPPALPYDYFHANSVSRTPDGNLLVSARCTWALYKLERKTGKVIWRLGGKRSDFHMGADTQFAWQHDARQLTASHITLFDDGAAFWDDGSGLDQVESQSRGVVLAVDEQARTVRLARSYRHPQPIPASAMGSFQELPDGHVVIGWGSEPVTSEFSADGKLLADWRLNPKHTSYRSYRYPWSGRPIDLPSVAVRRSARHRSPTLYVSWNGATALSQWLVQTGRHPGSLRPLGIAARRGFETVIPLGAMSGYAQVTALDAKGRHLASSTVVRL